MNVAHPSISDTRSSSPTVNVAPAYIKACSDLELRAVCSACSIWCKIPLKAASVTGAGGGTMTTKITTGMGPCNDLG